jgi:hypothetical protein
MPFAMKMNYHAKDLMFHATQQKKYRNADAGHQNAFCICFLEK